MSAQTQDSYYAFQQNLLKAASVIETRLNNSATSKTSTAFGTYGGTGESLSTLFTAITTFITNLG